MKFLIVEGNPVDIRNQRAALGATLYHRRFLMLLNFLGYGLNHDIVYPADVDQNLPDAQMVKEYDAVLITGSSLNAYQKIPSVTRQLDFTDMMFSTGLPIYGSCWGMQVATMVAGGVVEPSPNGREFGISQPIMLNQAGKKSPYFKNKPEIYNSLCIHEDEVTEEAENTTVLAYNAHSKAQAVILNYKKSKFFGVQYHPEFTSKDILIITRAISKSLFDQDELEGDLTDFDKVLHKMLPTTITDYAIHTLEVKNWLELIAKK